MQEAVSILKGFMQKNVAKRLGCIKVTIYALMGSYLVNAKFFLGYSFWTVFPTCGFSVNFNNFTNESSVDH